MTMSEEELRKRVSAAYDDVLKEPVPGRLTELLAEPEPNVVDLAAARERKAPREATRVGGLTWAQLGGIAASVLVGIVIGTQLPSMRGGDALIAQRGGEMVAGVCLVLVFVVWLVVFVFGVFFVFLCCCFFGLFFFL